MMEKSFVVKLAMAWEEKISKFFGLDDKNWLRHANPWSVYTRFTAAPFILLAIWSRQWLGWYAAIPIVLALIWTYINPILFAKAKSTKNWASRGTFGERIWIKREKYKIPKHHKILPHFLNIFAACSIPFLVYGLWYYDIWVTVAGMAIMLLAKCWYVDRMVWLYEDLKETREEFKNWEY